MKELRKVTLEQLTDSPFATLKIPGENVNIYALKDVDVVNEIARKYRQDGIYRAYGYEGNGLYRSAIARYSEFLTDYFAGGELTEEEILAPTEESPTFCNFTYEKDLKFSLCHQIPDLFPNYKIFGTNNEGVEYTIEGKRMTFCLKIFFRFSACR